MTLKGQRNFNKAADRERGGKISESFLPHEKESIKSCGSSSFVTSSGRMLLIPIKADIRCQERERERERERREKGGGERDRERERYIDIERGGGGERVAYQTITAISYHVPTFMLPAGVNYSISPPLFQSFWYDLHHKNF